MNREISNLVNLERLAHILKSLNNEELETLELLLDNEASQQIFSSIKELKEGKGVPIEQW
jgi:Mg/Co/Ni transporter MgtE